MYKLLFVFVVYEVFTHAIISVASRCWWSAVATWKGGFISLTNKSDGSRSEMQFIAYKGYTKLMLIML
jgi:hypothetical protein